MATDINRRLENARRKAEESDMHPLLFDRLHKPRSVFSSGHKIVMNFVPIFVSLFVPWGVFVLITGLTSFRAMYEKPAVVWVTLGVLAALWLLLSITACCFRRYDPNPSWYTYLTVSTLFFALLAFFEGHYIFATLTRPYYEVMDQHIRGNINAGVEKGSNLMDVGIVYFAPGNGLDTHRSWHFHYKTLYCVAPIITNGSAPMTQSYDFWAVGKDCCSYTASDFRCGSWGSPGTRGGIRVMNDEDIAYYRLAVQQAQSLYDITANHPIFVEWHEDPLIEVESWNRKAFRMLFQVVAFAFVTSLFCVTLAVTGFAWLGRRRYATDLAYGIEANSNEMPTYTNP